MRETAKYFRDMTFAGEYDRRLSSEGYPGNLLDAVAGGLAGSDRLIDVGAGTGFFSIPLAGMGFNVTAVEPSPAMRAIFRRKIMAGDLAARIAIAETDWESWDGNNADGLLCVHSVYGMIDLKAAVSKMKDSAPRVVLVVKADVGTVSMSEIIRAHFRAEKVSQGFPVRLRDALEDLRIPYAAREIMQERCSVFTDLTEEARYYRSHLQIGDEKAEEVERLIAAHAVRDGERFLFRGVYRDVLFRF